MNWHAQQITKFQQTFDLSNYQVNWIAYGKGVVTGLVIGLFAVSAASSTPANVQLTDNSGSRVIYGCQADITENYDGSPHVVTVTCREFN